MPLSPYDINISHLNSLFVKDNMIIRSTYWICGLRKYHVAVIKITVTTLPYYMFNPSNDVWTSVSCLQVEMVSLKGWVSQPCMLHEITMINTLQASQALESNYSISITGHPKMIRVEYFMEFVRKWKLCRICFLTTIVSLNWALKD